MSTPVVFYNGSILTQDPKTPSVEALAVAEGRIVSAGTLDAARAVAGPKTRFVDLEEGCLLPGFNDAHVHIWKVGHLLTTMVDLRSIRSLSQLKQSVVAASAGSCGDSRDSERWILGRGYNEAQLVEGRQPTRRDLDEAVSDRPVALTRTCGHMMVVNSRALELAGVDASTTSPPGGRIERDESGVPTGLLQENAQGLMKAVMPKPSIEGYQEMVTAASSAQLEKGITSATDAGCYPDLLEAYRRLETSGLLRVRVNAMAMRIADGDEAPLELPERTVTDTLRIDSVKLFADGGLSGATAALKENYRDMDSKGLLRLSAEELWDLSEAAHQAGLRICTHAIGDAAIEGVLSVYERLAGLGSQGHRLEHFGLPDAGHIARAARVGAFVAPQTIFIHSLGSNFRRYLTEPYLQKMYPVRSMLAAGLTVALSSDAPVVADDNPLLGIKAALDRRDIEGHAIAPDESIALSQALYAYTMGGALASGDEANRGSLSVGKWADLVWLDRDPRSVPIDSLPEIKVRETWVAGQCVYQA